MSNKNPLVSIVMPVYNAEKYLEEAVISALHQTYDNIELIAVNDGSKDNSEALLKHFANQDKRLRIISQENTGIVGALNNGIAAARGEFIARLDADDVNFLARIEKQVEAFSQHPHAVLVATGFEVIDEDSEYMYREILPTRDEDIKRMMFLYNPIAHGSVMFKKSAFERAGGYSDTCGPTEDYELWTRLAQLGEFLGLEAILYRWRQNRNGITFTNNPAMQAHTKRNLAQYWQQNDIKFMTRTQIVQTGKYYLRHGNKYGADTKNIVYANIAQLSIKLIRNGRPLDGLRQLLALASTGRMGLKLAFYRVTTIFKVQLLNVLGMKKAGLN
jgi:glycosyltransferase involved in cell wall biosynthesis